MTDTKLDSPGSNEEATGSVSTEPGRSPLVSVLLPVRNGESHVDAAIESMLRQTLTDLEVLVVDDGSADGTPDRLEDWAARDRRVRVLTQPARGIVTALERGRAEARGRWIARMDADDVSEPRRLELQREAMASDPDLVACGCRVRYFPRTELGSGSLRYERWINDLVSPADIERDLFVECPLAHPTFFLDAEALERAGGWRDVGWPEDYDLLFRLRAAGGRFGKIPAVLHAWRERPDRLSRVDPRYTPDAFRRCKVHWLLRDPRAAKREIVVWGAGPTGKRFARELGRQGRPVAAFVDLDPRKLGKRIHGAPVVSPPGIGAFEGAFCVAAVGQAGAREEIRGALTEAGWRECADFVAVA
jgi:cellulose synthase/poly-beta-1,6-N-acetylglucosamine synthase-like glycosyltransferase